MKKIYFNKEAAQMAIRNRKEYYGQINAFGEALAKEGITLTNEILMNFLSGKQGYLSAILVNAACAQFEKTGMVLNSVMLASLQQNADRVSKDFDKYRHAIVFAQQRAGIGPDLVNIMEDGKAVFNDSERAEIEKENTYFLKRQDESLYQKLTEIAASLNQAQEDLKEHNLDFFKTMREILSSGSYVQDLNLVFHPRGDVVLLLNKKGKIEANPVIFG